MTKRFPVRMTDRMEKDIADIQRLLFFEDKSTAVRWAVYQSAQRLREDVACKRAAVAADGRKRGER